jgi:hypothetical protein
MRLYHNLTRFIESTIQTDGGTLQMQADVLPANSTLPMVYWTVNNSIITILKSPANCLAFFIVKR